MASPKQHQLQYTEFWQARTGLTFGVERILFNRQSAYQHVQVLQTDAFGRMLTLDGLVMLTERDEFVYHEMISHPALCLLPRPRRVLIVGGGDGGTLREVLRYSEIEQVDLVEIDEVVIEAARTCFPELSIAFDDPRAVCTWPMAWPSCGKRPRPPTIWSSSIRPIRWTLPRGCSASRSTGTAPAS